MPNLTRSEATQLALVLSDGQTENLELATIANLLNDPFQEFSAIQPFARAMQQAAPRYASDQHALIPC